MRTQAWVLGMYSGASLHFGIPRISSDTRDNCSAPISKATCGIRYKAQH